MNHRKSAYSFISILFIFSLILAEIIFSFRNQELKVVFFNIGQGDSIFIQKGSNQILIDGGPSGKVELEKLGEYMPFWDRKIEIVLATHPDKDHILGLTDVMENYEVGALIDNGMKNKSAVYQKYIDIVKQKNIKRLKGEKGMNIKFGEAELKIVYPKISTENNSSNTNENGIIAKLDFGQNSFLFTGDFPTKNDYSLFRHQTDLSSKVLKVAHHGSKNSTSLEFLEKVNPSDAIISSGKNSYGHPTSEVLERLSDKNIKILRTDELGDIKYACTQEKCEIKTDF